MVPTEGKRFTCRVCGTSFTVSDAALSKYPGWTPQRCRRCWQNETGPRRKISAPVARPRTEPAAPAQGTAPPPLVDPWPTGDAALDSKLRGVLQRYSGGPQEGIFTDGGSSGNPGPGGWGAVRVKGGIIVAQQFGREQDTTNNRMELSALIAGYGMVTPDEEVTLWSDSQLCVNIVNSWAAAWERRGWRRKEGPIKNLELVKEVYALARERPKARLTWIAAHNGSRWNEYVDTLATGHLK